MLARLDKEEAEERERKKLEKREERKRVTAERQKAARESKRLEREEVNLAKKASRKALAGSTGFNSTIVSVFRSHIKDFSNVYRCHSH